MTEFNPDITNEMFRLATQLVNESNRNIFLTGKAGTGKTTFLKFIRETSPKQMAVVAPTGVAAINAGGVTMHSFFQLPLSPFIPDTKQNGFGQNYQGPSNKHSLLQGLRYNTEKRKIIQQLELLVIDEISMVRCDVLDAIDLILRHVRHRYLERFGGVQMLFIGDMMQLPPVIRDEDWRVLSPYYSGYYFFNSHVLQEDPPLCIEFNKIYRQNEASFLELLNKVRDNELDEEAAAILENRFNPSFNPEKQEGYIILTTHNNKATEINTKELQRINSPLFTYEAKIDKEFSDRSFPAELSLQLKVGAQVMFIRNDSADRGKRYFNGKIGIVARLEQDKIVVECKNNTQDEQPSEIEVSRETWENIRYKLNKSSGHLDTEVLGTFTQYPLRLAWAITIHKSQGLTFEKAIIDAGQAFAPGQIYVALSRCTTLQGLVLRSRIRNTGLTSDPAIVAFSKNNGTGQQLNDELAISRKNYLKSILLSTFDYHPIIKTIAELRSYAKENSSSFNEPCFPWIAEVIMKLDKAQNTANKFGQEIIWVFQQDSTGNNQQFLQKRITAGSTYFMTENEAIVHLIRKCPAITDSWIHAKDFNELLRDAFEQIASKTFAFEGLTGSLDIENFLQRKKQFLIPSFHVNVYAGASRAQAQTEHPLLYQKLKKLRDSICLQKNLPIYLVVGSKAIEEMVRFLPQDLSELRKISGFGDVKIDQYGGQFLEIIKEYSQEKNLSSLIHEKSPKRERLARPDRKHKKNTRAESLRLFKEGISITDIAMIRSLVSSTIAGHLADYIRQGAIDIEELLTPDKFSKIEHTIGSSEHATMTSVKEILGDDVSYDDIRFAMASLEFKKSITEADIPGS